MREAYEGLRGASLASAAHDHPQSSPLGLVSSKGGWDEQRTDLALTSNEANEGRWAMGRRGAPSS